MKKQFSSNELPLAELLDKAASGELQLPDFQRGWVWDDDHIQSLLASISLSYPIGAVMTLVAGNPGVNFKARLLEGVDLSPKPEPETLLLDGQQRVTSLYQALRSREPVHTRTSRGKELYRHYYANIESCINVHADREEEGIVGVPEDRIMRSDFGRAIDLDLSTRDKEIAAQMFPLDIILDGADTMDWQMVYLESGPGQMAERVDKWKRFQLAVVNPFMQYQVPTIDLAKSTPKEAVCQVFEKVNTGGVTLTVFELLTATFAADNFELRKDWEERQKDFHKVELLKRVDATSFLQIVTLLATYNRRGLHLVEHPNDDKAPAISCKRPQILRLPLEDYKSWADRAQDGLQRTSQFLRNQCIFRYRDLPYTTQLVPLAAILGLLKDRAESHESLKKLAQWFWCGVFGEMYGGGVETRFAIDLEDCVAWIDNSPHAAQPRTIQAAQFQAERLLTLRTRNSAAFKGLHALQIKQGAQDFRYGKPIDIHAHVEQAIDIRHIFPRDWCSRNEIEKGIANCIVNKTAIDARTNRSIGRSAPSTYLSRIESGGGIESHKLNLILHSHDIDPGALRRNDFGHFFNKRFEKLLGHVEKAMRKPVNRRPDRDESPFAQRAMDVESGVRALIESGESAIVEFKSTAFHNMHSERRDNVITWAVIKTIAAFLNSAGGTLLIGVNDSGDPVGIELDYPYVRGQNRDGWELAITSAVKNALGQVTATDISVVYCAMSGRTIARINVPQGVQPTFASQKGVRRDMFFARLNNATEELSGQALLAFREQRWSQ